MKYKLFAVALVLSLLVIAPGCGPSTPPTCTLGQLQKPYLLYPTMWEVVSSVTPTLTWTYPAGPFGEYPSPYYYGADACLPENYRVTLRTGPFFTDNLGGDTPNAAGTFVTPLLQPGTEYAWAVQPLVGGVPGPSTSYRTFFTGPACNAATLVAPELVEPANGAVVSSDQPNLIWDYPEDCVPGRYRVEWSTTSSFTHIVGVELANPRVHYEMEAVLDNCQTYYWRVTPLTGTTAGPTSEVFHFRIYKTGTLCPLSFDWPIYKVLMNASCRFGPGLDYNIMDYLAAGDERQAEGRNEDGSWILLRLDGNRRCWVARDLGELPGDPLDLPLAEYPPRPIPEYNCSAYRDNQSCEANSNCKWVVLYTGEPYCTNK